MKTTPFRYPYRRILAVFGSLAFGVLPWQLRAQVTLIDFDSIPPYPALVDSFGQLFPGITLTSDNKWLADEVNNSVFENINNRSISTFGSDPLTIDFDAPAEDVTVDLGSGELGVTLSIGITGYRENKLIFADSFVTHMVPGGADEVRAHTVGTVDRVVIAKTSGGTVLTLDNLSFVTVTERDSDGDGVPDSRDLCPGSAEGAVVDTDGCSIDQLVPCAGPPSGGTWRNHGHYLSAVAKAAAAFVASGLITEEQASAVVSMAARSSCGKK